MNGPVDFYKIFYFYSALYIYIYISLSLLRAWVCEWVCERVVGINYQYLYCIVLYRIAWLACHVMAWRVSVNMERARTIEEGVVISDD